MLGHSPGHMHGSQGMLESGVIGPGIDCFHQAQLLYSLKPLHWTGSDDLPLQRVYRDGPMNWIANDLSCLAHEDRLIIADSSAVFLIIHFGASSKIAAARSPFASRRAALASS